MTCKIKTTRRVPVSWFISTRLQKLHSESNWICKTIRFVETLHTTQGHTGGPHHDYLTFPDVNVTYTWTQYTIASLTLKGICVYLSIIPRLTFLLFGSLEPVTQPPITTSMKNNYICITFSGEIVLGCSPSHPIRHRDSLSTCLSARPSAFLSIILCRYAYPSIKS